MSTPFEERELAYLRQLAAEARASSAAMLRQLAERVPPSVAQFIREMDAAEDAERLAQSYEARADRAEAVLQKRRR
jgi:hypothetical protein